MIWTSKDYEQWHKWFAWHSVSITTRRDGNPRWIEDTPISVWCQTIERRVWDWGDGEGPLRYEYRLVGEAR